MQVKNHKLKARLVMRTAFLALCAVLFALPVKAQTRANEIRMKTGVESISDAVTYNFYDSGGPYIMTPSQDPNNEYNWVTWYQHNESYVLHLTNPVANIGKGIRIDFNYLLVNNDHLEIFEGDGTNAENLIVDLTNNDFSTGYDTINQKYSVMSHGNMTIRFTSDYHWRDAGWHALLATWNYVPQPPVALMEACENNIVLLNGSKGTTSTAIYYTTDGSVPVWSTSGLTNGTLYEGPFPITQATTVKAITVENGTTSSTVSTYVFNRLITPPAEPTITHVPNTNIVIITAPPVPSDQNDTYYVRYSIDGGDPRYSHLEQDHGDTIELAAPCTVKAVTRGTTCPDIFSDEVDEEISTIYVPTPVINITGSGANGTVEITCSLSDATIYYTIDGNDPTTSSTPYNGSFTVPAGTTVKAMAYKEGQGYVASNIASAIYIPGGQGGQGVYGTVVLLDDREDHSWSYYSDGDQPVHSLNPADVKITYFGNGTRTVTSASENQPNPTSFSEDATTVAVSGYEAANQFVYLKTLEAANADGTGNYPYTLIPNPFSKRPTVGTISTNAGATCWRGFYGWRIKRLSGGLSIKVGNTTYTSANINSTSIIFAETEVEFITENAEGNEVEFESMWAQAWFATAVNNTSNLNANVTYERNFIRIAGAINTTNSIPATIMELYPNGTTNGSTAATAAPNTARNLSGYSLSADTKFEFIALNRNNGTMTANGHNLCFGRGINASRNAAHVQGISGAYNGDLTYTMRVESGRYDLLAYVAEISCTVSGRVQVKAIMGSDYDRAKKDNSLLAVSRENNLFFTRDVSFSSQDNKDEKVFDLVVKSGEYQKNYWTNNGDETGFQYTHSMYCGANFGSSSNNAHYPGVRYVTIEGGALGNVNGGRGTRADGNNNNPGATTPGTDASKVSFNLRIKKDAVINGCVFGGAANTSAWGSKRIVVTGGEVLSWIAGGANGTNTTNGDSRTRGAAYIYVGGDAKVGGPNAIRRNGTLGGQVFGAGRGNTNQAASMDSSYVVIADNAKIMKKSSDAAGNVYGGGNIGYIAHKSHVYILGGTIEGSVFGGAYGNALDIPSSTVVVKGGTVSGSVYGGSNSTGTVENDSIYMSGGTVTNVYGGGLGASTRINGDAEVNIAGGTINNNVYGGGELGTVTGNTEVAVSGGTMKNIFGAGKGGSTTANIGGTTAVTVSGGTISESVYGGGENGNVKQANNPAKGDPEGPRDITAVSTVEITGGNIAHNVFGGGSMGFTNGGTLVNMSGGTVEGSVFGGAFGTQGKVYVAGQRTVNLRGGTINKHVYGGSRNADDALTFNPGAFPTTTTTTASVVNMSGGYVHYQVFASGYFGKVFGSTYAFIGTNAIMNAPHHVAGTNPYNEAYYNQHQALRIGGSVWAGGDFGNYDGSKFGDPTITGRSNVYVDGTGYDTESNNTTNTNYMYIGGSIYGSGTSCDAGRQGRHIIVRNYGSLINASQPTAALPYSSATRSLYSIQRADSLVIDNSHIVFLGEGKINSLVTTEKYGIHEFRLVRMANGSSIFLNYPADQIMKFGSYTCEDVYDNEGSATYTKVNYDGLGTSAGPTDNKVRVNNGAYIQIKYTDANNVERYGELEGFAHMMSDDANNTCAYARPKQSKDSGNQIDPAYDNPLDGGFVSYDASLNTYDAGTLTNNAFANVSDAPGTVSSGIQMPYENHTLVTKNGEQYFRIWRAGGQLSYREGVFVAQSKPKTVGDEITFDYYSTVDVVIDLPAFENCDEGTAFYRIKSLSDGNTTIDYGTDVMTVNAACYGNVDANNWMYIDGNAATSNFVTGQTQAQCSDLHYIKEMPNVNFGLVAIPTGGLEGNDNMLICEASDKKIATMQWANNHNEIMPKVTFRLTYHNNLTNNVVWDPINITFEQVDCEGQIKSTVDVALTVTTLTSIDQDFLTQAYAVMRGNGTGLGSYTAKVVLPQYVMHVNTVGEISDWTCEQVTWAPEPGYGNDCFVGGTNYLNEHPEGDCNNKFGMKLSAGLNFDNTTGWESGYDQNPVDMYNWPASSPTDSTDYVFGSTTARNPIGFDFDLQFDDRQKASSNYKLGVLTFKMKFTNYEGAGSEPYSANLNIKIEVWILGQGANYYIDGVNGNNLYSGRHPNAAKQTLSGIFNRTDYVAGDYIFVVDSVTADGSSTLMWNGKSYSEVTLYRYPGGHECVPNEEGAESHYHDFVDRPYQGPLVVVEKEMEMTGIVLNGFDKESQKDAGTAAGDLVTGGVEYFNNYQPANAPLVKIKDGGRLSVYGSSRMEYNYNATTDGGGVYIEDGGVLNLYDGSAIDTNYVASGKNGGGVYVNTNSKVQLSDLVYITGNKQGNPNAKADNSVDNNVYLSTYDSHVDVGTVDTEDPYTMLLAESRVGITKNPAWGSYYYAPVAMSDGGQSYLGNLVDSEIMWDDQHRYEIVSLNNTHLNPSTDYVYFVGTWVTAVTTEPEGYSASAIDTPEELAWAISVASGYNNQTAAPNTAFTLTGDIDMNANIWVPIGSNGNAYKGVFNGNGHVVTGLRSPMNQENMGMFGITEGAEITNLIAVAEFDGGSMKNIGTVVGKMNGGLLSNVEAAGTLTGTNSTENVGGLVGHAVAGTIHSAFAVNTMTGGNNTVMGGLVGTNAANLYNAYANTTLSGTTATKGGLVGVNSGEIENCYAIIGENTFPAFAYTNTGTISFCYADNDNGYVNSGLDHVSSHGNYGAVQPDIKHLEYMYRDNLLTANLNTYVGGAGVTSYVDNHTPVWNGMLSALNQWVKANPKHLDQVTSWNRPINNAINGDLPILAFPKDQSLATLNSNGNFLQYSTGLDNLLEDYTDPSGIFVYGAVTGVENVPANENVKVTIAEDAVLIQADNAGDFNATVGITFDNSDHGQHAVDNLGQALTYDWHMMSTPLQDAAFGTTYDPDATLGYGQPVDIASMVNGYFPNDLPMGAGYEEGVKWDFYTYYEPQYHWINFKRSINNHWHYDVINHTHPRIEYTEDDQTNGVFTPGKGYMMAISQDSYMNSTGKLNNGNVTITLTNAEPDDIDFNKGWNLVGNPYQAYLNMAPLGALGYKAFAYNADLGVYSPFVMEASENPATLADCIHPHQAFFVYTATDGTQLVFDKTTMATTEKTDNSYFRGDKINYPLVNIFAENESGNRDMTIIEFNRPEIGGALEIQGLRNANFHIAASLDGQGYGLLFAPEGTDRVPVRFYTNENGTFTLTWETLHGNFTSLLLVDNMTGTITDMLRSDHYSFDATIDDYASRFYITFAVTDVEEYNEGEDFAWFDGSEWVINGKGNLDVVDVLGRTIYSTRLTDEQNRINLNGVAKGVYLLRVSEGNNAKVQKVVVR